MRRTKRGGWPYSQPPNVPFTINRASPQAKGLVLWMPWGGGTPGAHRHVDRISGLVFTEGGTPVWVADGERGWSMLFDDAQSEYLERDQAPITAAPLTVSAWVYCDDNTAAQTVVYIGDKDGDNVDLWILQLSAAGVSAIWAARRGAWRVATTTAGYSVNTWHNICGVEYASNSRAAFIDGGNKGTNAQDMIPVGVDRVAIGRRGDFTPSNYFSGRVADVRIYNRILTDTEIWRLYINPWELVHPLVRRVLVGVAVAPPVGGHMTLWGRYWGP